MDLKRKPAIKHPSTIELNGVHYDALSGKPLATSRQESVGVASENLPRANRLSHPPAPSKRVHKATEPSHTLMRHAVKRPGARVLNSTKNTPATTTKPTVTPHSPNKDKRSERANMVHQNSLVSRFGDVLNTPIKMPTYNGPMPFGITKRVGPLEVMPEPEHHHVRQGTLTPKDSRTRLLQKGLSAASNHQPVKSGRTKLRHRAANRLGVSPRLIAVAAGGLATLLLGAFVAYQNVPNLAVRYASIKAGFHASLPGYKPAGFAINDNIQYSPGQITISFKANADEREYTITQKKTDWNSNDLHDNYVASAGSSGEFNDSDGRKIYLYGESNATWVDDGVWYNISGNSSLNTDQLIKISGSL